MSHLARPAVLAAATALGLAALPATADYVTMPSPNSVSETADALVAAIGEAGASVIARVDHAGAAGAAGMELPPSQLVIFGNPAVGTPAMQQDIRAGLVLPLRVLVYEDADGATQVFYEVPEDMVADFGIDPDSDAVTRIAGALGTLTAKAVE